MAVFEFLKSNPSVVYNSRTISKHLGLKRNGVTRECFDLVKKGLIRRADPVKCGCGSRVKDSDRLFALVTEPNATKA